MNREELVRQAENFTQQSELNRVPDSMALLPELAGMTIFDSPLFAIGSAEDPCFETFKRPEAVGAHFMTPGEWLPGARSVISFFLPFTEAVRTGNRRDYAWPSYEWLHARIEGQAFVRELSLFIQSTIRGAGASCVVPLVDERFFQAMAEGRQRHGQTLFFTSNWSERHVAFACGLGTFGLSKGLITKRGMAGRFGSVITTLPLEIDARAYRDVYEYCTHCGECARHCPANAISLSEGKDHVRCAAFVESTSKKHGRWYGCGKCQVGVSCEHGIPNH